MGSAAFPSFPIKPEETGVSITAEVPAAWHGLPRPFSAGGVKELNAGVRMLKTHPAMICHYKERRSQPLCPVRAPASEQGALTAASAFPQLPPGVPLMVEGPGVPAHRQPCPASCPESRAGPGLGWTLGGISSHKGRLDIGPGCPGRRRNHRPRRCLRKRKDMALGAAVCLTRRPSLTGR